MPLVCETFDLMADLGLPFNSTATGLQADVQNGIAKDRSWPNTDSLPNVPRKFVMSKKMPTAHCGGPDSRVARAADGMPAAARSLSRVPEY